MKRYVIVALIALAGLLVLTATNVANAQYARWSAIKETGYAVTSNWQGIDVPLGVEVVATAGTTDLDIENITFRWHDPADNTVWEDTFAVSGPLITPNVPSNIPPEVQEWADDNPGVSYLYAQSTHTPNMVGDWGVQAFFIGLDGKTKAGLDYVVQIRATSFNVIPEIPIIGTAGAAIAMLAGLGLFMKRRGKLV